MKKYLKLKINKIKYVKEIIKNYPGINSGRKNYYDQQLRVLKNILLAQAYEKQFKKKEGMFSNNLIFNKNAKFIKIQLDS